MGTQDKIGQVFTPEALADKMADMVWRHSGGTFFTDQVFDPCCGQGALLDACRKIGYPFTDGIDLDPEAVEECVRRGHNASVGDLFEYSNRHEILIVNPPYLGRGKVAAAIGADRLKELKKRYPAERAGAADLCAYVLRHCLEVVKPHISVWVTTKTITEGSSRRVGLQWAVNKGYEIVEAYTNFPWPGDAAVSVCVFALRRTF